MTHDELVNAAALWAEKRRRFRVVLRDVRCTLVSEQPDVIAWKSYGASLLVECKASRADFLRDRKKAWRRRAEEGMGYERYYAVPYDAFAVSVEELGGWGLLLVHPRGRVEVAKESGPFTKRNEAAERALLVSAVCRVTEGWGRRMLGPSAPLGPDGDPPPSTAKVIRELREENRRLRRAVSARDAEALERALLGSAP